MSKPNVSVAIRVFLALASLAFAALAWTSRDVVLILIFVSCAIAGGLYAIIGRRPW